ncbi:hypothetical protein MSIMFI_00098 [Mycobacterium simulans]|nr:hypothetical protein MSIMFI_00098 [Mycobacterium simulans]
MTHPKRCVVRIAARRPGVIVPIHRQTPQTRCATALLPLSKTVHYCMKQEGPLIHLLQYAGVYLT